MLALYTTECIISSIFESFENSREDVWYNFIKKTKPSLNIVLNVDSDYEYNDDNPIAILRNAYDLEIYIEGTNKDKDTSYIYRVIEMRLDVIDDPSAVFVLDITPELAKQISAKYGVICHSINDNPFESPLFQEAFEVDAVRKKKSENWTDILSKDNVFPSNSLVVIDRYLFSNDADASSQDGIDNLYDILNNILPKRLGVEYHILIVFDDKTLANGETFEIICNKINKLKKRLRGVREYPITIESVSIPKGYAHYDSTHNRRIISNYFILRVDHSLKAFKNGVGLYSQSIFLDWAASKGVIHSKKSHAPIKGMDDTLEELKMAIRQLMKSVGQEKYTLNGKGRDQGVLLSINGIRNRLLSLQ
ncbi:MAG: hypothetical protein K2L17_05660 [Muribaculaceae bacterium]|nr:hypothetical protein [Muribaculaceae bacterium]